MRCGAVFLSRSTSGSGYNTPHPSSVGAFSRGHLMNVTFVLAAALLTAGQQYSSEQMRKDLFHEAVKEIQHGSYKSAESSIKRAWLYARMLDAADPKRAEMSIEHARILGKQGRYGSALEKLNDADKILAQARAPDTSLSARSWNLRAEM